MTQKEPNTLKRPLRWLYGIAEQDAERVVTLTERFLGDLIPLTEALRTIGIRGLQLILLKDTPPRVDEATVIIGARLLLDVGAIINSLRRGYLASSIIPIREILHQSNLVAYLHAYPDDADKWLTANTVAERRQFDFGRIKDRIDLGAAWYQLYDFYPRAGHMNDFSKAAYAHMREFFGVDFVTTGWFNPQDLITQWEGLFRITYWFIENLIEWYPEVIPSDCRPQTERLFVEN